MGYIESLANNKFNGDVEAARAWLKENGKRGGTTGKKHLQKLSKAERTALAKKANLRSQEARKRRKELNGVEDYIATPLKERKVI